MNFFQTIHQKDFEDIRSLWGEIFGKQHPVVEKKELIDWFYDSKSDLLSSGFAYSKGDDSNLNAFIGYKTVKWFDNEEVWLCGFGASPKFPGAGLFLLRNFVKIFSDKTLCVVGFIPELGKVYKSMGFEIKNGYRNLAKIRYRNQADHLSGIYSSDEFFATYSNDISKDFYNSYSNLLKDHIVWKYFVFILENIAFFVRVETNKLCRVVMAFDLSNSNFEKLTDKLVDKLYLKIGEYFSCEYIDFICNIKFNIGSSRNDIINLDEKGFPGYFAPEAPYKTLNFAIKSNNLTSTRNIFFKADGDQERSNG